MPSLVLEYDDFCDQKPEDCLDFVEEKLRETPEIKITFFTVPAMRGRPIYRDEWVKRVKALIDSDNIRLAIHGCMHVQEEMKFLTYEQTVQRIAVSEKILNDLGLPFIKVFRPPHWTPGRDLHRALVNSGYSHWYNHEKHADMTDTALSFACQPIYSNFNLKDPVPKTWDLKYMIAHGHTHDVCENGIEQTWDKVLTINNRFEPQYLFADQI